MTAAPSIARPVQQSTIVADFLRLLHPPGTVFEIRAPQTSERSDGKWATTFSGYFTDLKLAAEGIANDIPEFAPAIYVTMNPVMPDLLARADNCIRGKAKATTQDADILKRRWLLFDIDPKRPAGISSTEIETSEAMKLAKSLREYLTRNGWPEPLRGMSGNGVYLLYRLDLPVDDDGLIRSVLESLAERFDSDKADIDTSVHNASRIIKALGTVARKGTDFQGNGEAEARPHRRSWFFPPEQGLTPLSVEQLRQVASSNPTTKTANKPLHTPRPRPRPRPGFDRFDHTPDGVENYLVEHGVEVRSRKPVSNGTMLSLNRCPVQPDIEDYEGSSIGVLVDDSGKISYDNWHKRAGGLGGTQWVDVRDALEPGYRAFSERQKNGGHAVKLLSGKRTEDKSKCDDGLVVESTDPLALAEHFIDTHYRDTDGRLLLRRHRADSYSFAGSCYQPLTDEEIDVAIYKHLEHCSTIQRDRSGAPKLDELANPSYGRSHRNRLSSARCDLLCRHAEYCSMIVSTRLVGSVRVMISTRRRSSRAETGYLICQHEHCTRQHRSYFRSMRCRLTTTRLREIRSRGSNSSMSFGGMTLRRTELCSSGSDIAFPVIRDSTRY